MLAYDCIGYWLESQPFCSRSQINILGSQHQPFPSTRSDSDSVSTPLITKHLKDNTQPQKKLVCIVQFSTNYK